MRSRSKLADLRDAAKVADDAPPVLPPDEMMHFLVPAINRDALFCLFGPRPRGAGAGNFDSGWIGRTYDLDGGKRVNVGDEVIMRKQLCPNLANIRFPEAVILVALRVERHQAVEVSGSDGLLSAIEGADDFDDALLIALDLGIRKDLRQRYGLLAN